MASLQPKPASSKRMYTGDSNVGSFKIEEEIGKGSFATVYRGYQRQSRLIVAIKSVNLAKLNKKLKENLYSEIDILKGLQHPHIVALIDCHETSNHINLVMEYCELGDLSLFIKRRDKLLSNAATADMARKYPNPVAGGLNEVITRHFLKQLASALEFLRARNLIHRDVKPQNLLLLPSVPFRRRLEKEEPNAPLIMSVSEKSNIPSAGIDSLPILKLADFGFARSLPSTSLAETLCGSPLYMAPEILRYEKYDAKADLWSVGTVLFEMVTGKPPFRASNHVELLRKIEQGNDIIKFPKESVVSPGMKDLIRALLKRGPVERLSFENFFTHEVVTETIPGLVGDDRPKERIVARSEESQPMSRQASNRETRRIASDSHSANILPHPSSPGERLNRDSLNSGRSATQQIMRPSSGTPPRLGGERALGLGNPAGVTRVETQGIKRPEVKTANTAPNRQPVQDLGLGIGAVKMIRNGSRDTGSPDSSLLNEAKDRNTQRKEDPAIKGERERAAQLMADNEYVLVQKEQVEVNALADEMDRLSSGKGQSLSPRSTLPARRATTQGQPGSATGAVPPIASRAVQIAQGRPRPESPRQISYGSPNSATSAISKAIQGASLRLFGIGYGPLVGRGGQSPPQHYSAFPAYPTSAGIAGLIGEKRSSGHVDEDAKAVNDIEESATRSDVVYGFAEVKYKQLIPLAPSMSHGLGGAGEAGMLLQDEDGLTPDAIVALSEEALVLYVKALSLLAKCMAIAGAWWARKTRSDGINTTSSPRSDIVSTGNRINSAVQWVRSRFNEVLEKAEFARLKLVEAQKQLPEDHPGHPNNHTSASKFVGGATTNGVVFSSGITAEKLMYDRALEMSRSAAVSEILNEDLPGCEISYVTAVRMLEAVLENDDDLPQRKTSNAQTEERKLDETPVNGINIDDRQAVQKVAAMIRARLITLRKKMAHMAAVNANAKHQSLPQHLSRPSSTHSGGTTPTIPNTPPQ